MRQDYTLVHRTEWRNHSVFLCFEQTAPTTLASWRAPTSYLHVVDLYFSRFQATGRELDRLVEQNLGEAIYLCPASVYSQYLLAHMTKPLELTGVLDNSTEKQGKILYGTNLIVYSPEILGKTAHPLVILCAGDHTPQIQQQILTICPGARIHVID